MKAPSRAAIKAINEMAAAIEEAADAGGGRGAHGGQLFLRLSAQCDMPMNVFLDLLTTMTKQGRIAVMYDGYVHIAN